MDEDATDSPQGGGEELLAAAPAMRDAIELARRAACVHSTVLVTGETGTGKERIASFIHARSPRSERPFVKVNCAALPETLIEWGGRCSSRPQNLFTTQDGQKHRVIESIESE